MFWKFQQVLLFGKGVHLSWALVFYGLSTLLCAKSFLVVKGISLEEYRKGFGWVFLPCLRRVSQDISCVLVHGVSSCDLVCCNILVYG
jgi:hypothetical protein